MQYLCPLQIYKITLLLQEQFFPRNNGDNLNKETLIKKDNGQVEILIGAQDKY